MVNSRGQMLPEFVIVLLLLLAFGYVLFNRMLSHPDGAFIKAEDTAAEKIAQD